MHVTEHIDTPCCLECGYDTQSGGLKRRLFHININNWSICLCENCALKLSQFLGGLRLKVEK